MGASAYYQRCAVCKELKPASSRCNPASWVCGDCRIATVLQLADADHGKVYLDVAELARLHNEIEELRTAKKELLDAADQLLASCRRYSTVPGRDYGLAEVTEAIATLNKHRGSVKLLRAWVAQQIEQPYSAAFGDIAVTLSLALDNCLDARALEAANAALRSHEDAVRFVGLLLKGDPTTIDQVQEGLKKSKT